MTRAFFMAGAIEIFVLFVSATITAGVTERMTVTEAGNGLMIFGLIDLLVIGFSAWLYRRLGTVWGGRAVPAWSVVLYCMVALPSGIMMFFATMVLLNR